MRPIKFRGLSINGEWFHGNLALIQKKVDHIKPGSYISNSAGMPFAYQVRPETVGQLTGLKDRGGKEIYEGDILSFDEKEWGGPCVFAVEWIDAGWSGSGVAYSDWMQWCKVAGNIHQHQGLLSWKEEK